MYRIGIVSRPDGFIIKQAPPVITSVSPNQSDQGETLDVIISGSNLDGVSAVSFGTGITINNFTNRSPTQIAVNISIDTNTTTGTRDVLVTTASGTSTLSGSFTVNERPLGTLFVALIWVGIALIVILLGIILSILRHRRATRL